jgi:hypothetical protein
MEVMEITAIRRAQLKKWFEFHSIPAKEKSYLSQLMTGTASFGERAARRIETTYGMTAGYLDGVEGETSQVDLEIRNGNNVTLVQAKVSADPDEMSLMWVTSKGRKLLTLFYGTDSEGQDSILRAAEAVPRVIRPAAVNKL